MKKIAFITSEEDPNLIADDQLVIAPLRTLGFSVFPLVWDRVHPPLESFDALVFRSCWNYHRKYSEFLTWLETVKSSGTQTFNPIDVNIWNLDKRYLLELASNGARIPRTSFIPPKSSFNQKDIEEKLIWIAADQVVVKPSVSLNGHDTHMFARRETQEIYNTITALSHERGVLVQEFIPEIKTSGETSLVFFDGEFSHAIRKVPSSEEFRVQTEYGGSRSPILPDGRLISQAREILSLVGHSLLYSRVDLVETSRGGVLIELEAIDPMLFLGSSSGAPERFANAIAKRFCIYPGQ